MVAWGAVTTAAAAVLALTTGLLIGGVTPAGAHGNHISVDAQASENGTVVIESLFTSAEEGYVALHTDDDGEPGRVIGYAPADYDFHTGLSVELESSTWAEWNGSRTVWAVLHRDDGDGSFDLETDEALSSFGGSASARFTLEKRASGPASVVVIGFRSQPTDNASATIRRVALGRSGALVVRTDENGSPGDVVGRTSLDAGVHENLTVPINESYYRDHGPRFTLWAALEERGEPVAVDGTPVASEFVVRTSVETGGVVNTPATFAGSRTEDGDTSAITVSATGATADTDTTGDTAGDGTTNTDDDSAGLGGVASGVDRRFGFVVAAAAVLVLAGGLTMRSVRR